jgi:hypothetical protein
MGKVVGRDFACLLFFFAGFVRLHARRVLTKRRNEWAGLTMQHEPDSRRQLTPNERSLAKALGLTLLAAAFLCLVAAIALVRPMAELVEGLSK